ncbi:hypothetical protein EVJ58_g3597 [Rhodofomes roseus]|uniref:Uncharacterized protein n=1 Tax=Rhodofomes roseus TaxID=34475 RepID=A0A4Y9YJY5_9APHY|nr:hypothetical protein EVJ58_g3597 [Rhodofomes roseus]
MFPLIEDEGRTEYPFPPVPPTAMDAVEPSSSSSDTLPSAPSRIGSRSSRSSPAPAQHLPRERDYAYDHDHSWAGASGKAKLLARLMTRSERDANHYRSMLMLANERLEHETRRADDAEQRAIDTLQRLRQARDQIAQAHSDVSRANEETRLWKLRVEEAQREISRAQEIVDRLEQDKLDAEAEAARARTLARKLKEEKVIARAREEGRQQGFQEGLSKGREMNYYEARAVGITSRNEPGRYTRRPAVVDDMSDEEEQDENATGSGSQPEEIIPITRSPPPQTWRPPSRSEETRSTMRSPRREPTSPIRVRSPRIAAPSPVHPSVPPPATTPNPVSVLDPSVGRSRSRQDEAINPIPIHNAVPSPSHPPVDIPPDNWIPYMSSDNVIELPPPHEMTKPLTPRASSSSLIEATMRVPASSATTYEQPVRARDYAYTAGAGPSQPYGSAFSPLSKASTAISQYEIVSSRGDRQRSASHGRSPSDMLAGLRDMISSPSGRKTPARQAREDSPRGPRPKEEPFMEASHPDEWIRRLVANLAPWTDYSGRSGKIEHLPAAEYRTSKSSLRYVVDFWDQYGADQLAAAVDEGCVTSILWGHPLPASHAEPGDVPHGSPKSGSRAQLHRSSVDGEQGQTRPSALARGLHSARGASTSWLCAPYPTRTAASGHSSHEQVGYSLRAHLFGHGPELFVQDRFHAVTDHQQFTQIRDAEACDTQTSFWADVRGGTASARRSLPRPAGEASDTGRCHRHTASTVASALDDAQRKKRELIGGTISPLDTAATLASTSVKLKDTPFLMYVGVSSKQSRHYN